MARPTRALDRSTALPANTVRGGTGRAGDAVGRHRRGAGERRPLLVGRLRRVWERMSQQVRDGITQADFVTFYETCKTTGPRIRVAGMLLDAANGQAIVRAKVGSVERSRTMLFEDGKWVMKPTQEFAAHLGEPVQKIIAEETAVGLCGK